jgi:hypothetical protein
MMTRKRLIQISLANLGFAVASCLAFPIQTLAADLSGYFSISYSCTLSHTQITPGESVDATVTGTATCTADLPVSVSQGIVTGQIVAQGANPGSIVLNPGYTVTVDPFPCKKGESSTDSETVTLTFPIDMAPGQYSIIGQVISAKIKWTIIWVNVIDYVPSDVTLGEVTIVPAGIPAPVQPTGSTTPTDAGNNQGSIPQGSNLPSQDGQCILMINPGTKVVDADGKSLQQVTPTPSAGVMPVFQGMAGISLAYDLSPQGATFDPFITITLKYSRDQVPPGVDETRLFMARWDKTAGRWQEIAGCVVNTQGKTISAKISQSGSYRAMAPTSTASSAAPAVTFSVLGLTVAVVLTALGLTAMAILFFLRHRHSKSPEGPIILELPNKD